MFIQSSFMTSPHPAAGHLSIHQPINPDHQALVGPEDGESLHGAVQLDESEDRVDHRVGRGKDR